MKSCQDSEIARTCYFPRLSGKSAARCAARDTARDSARDTARDSARDSARDTARKKKMYIYKKIKKK